MKSTLSPTPTPPGSTGANWSNRVRVGLPYASRRVGKAAMSSAPSAKIATGSLIHVRMPPAPIAKGFQWRTTGGLSTVRRARNRKAASRRSLPSIDGSKPSGQRCALPGAIAGAEASKAEKHQEPRRRPFACPAGRSAAPPVPAWGTRSPAGAPHRRGARRLWNDSLIRSSTLDGIFSMRYSQGGGVGLTLRPER